ncbi:MAG: hypothetical protein ABJF01_16330 [bacterium]
MRIIRTLAFVPSLVLAACSGESITAPRLAPDAPAAESPGALGLRARPISGHCELTTLSTTPAPAPPVFRQVAAGTCTLSHLGRSTVDFIQLVNLGANTQQSETLTYTAANGDVLEASGVGTSTPTATGVNFSSTITFIGGTGRFVNATGQAHVEGAANLVAGTSRYTLHGSISHRDN